MSKEALKFKVDGLTLRGNLYQPEGRVKNFALLFIHGWTGKPNEKAAEFLTEHGYISMTFSLSGHNDSEGNIEDQTRQKSINELIGAYDLLKTMVPKGTEIGIAGNSYGGYLAPLLSKKRQLNFIQMRVPANYKDDGFDEIQLGKGHENREVTVWRNEPLDWQSSKALKALHDFKGPIQIIEAEFDDAVPHQTVQNYVDAISDKSKLEYILWKDAAHSIGDDQKLQKEYNEMLLSWLEKIQKIS